MNQVALVGTGLLEGIPRWISVLSLFAALVSRSSRLAAEWIRADQGVDNTNILLDELVALVRDKLVALVCVSSTLAACGALPLRLIRARRSLFSQLSRGASGPQSCRPLGPCCTRWVGSRSNVRVGSDHEAGRRAFCCRSPGRVQHSRMWVFVHTMGVGGLESPTFHGASFRSRRAGHVRM